jgi:hypothetical protein
VLLLVVLFRFTMSQARYRVELCIDFNGRSNCASASGSTEQFTTQAATTNACATIASGVTEVMQCEHTPPSRVTWLKKP